MNRLTIFIALFFLSFTALADETMIFDMFLMKDKIGSMTVNRKVLNDSTEVFLLTSQTRAKILWMEYENTSRHEVVYQKGKLIKSTHKEIQNGKVKRFTNVTWDGKVYQVESYKGKWTINEPLTFSIPSLYFKDVRSVKRMFYDAEGDFADIKNTAPGTYEFKGSDGNRNVYIYENGQLKRMEFHVSIASVKAERRPGTYTN